MMTTLTIELTVKVLEDMPAGLSLQNETNGKNIVAIPARHEWKRRTKQETTEALIHEIGHLFGMAAKATTERDDGPDRIPTYYEKKGDHCNHKDSSGACVMSGNIDGSTAFCKHCAVAMKKQDLRGRL